MRDPSPLSSPGPDQDLAAKEYVDQLTLATHVIGSTSSTPENPGESGLRSWLVTPSFFCGYSSGALFLVVTLALKNDVGGATLGLKILGDCDPLSQMVFPSSWIRRQKRLTYVFVFVAHDRFRVSGPFPLAHPCRVEGLQFRCFRFAELLQRDGAGTSGRRIIRITISNR